MFKHKDSETNFVKRFSGTWLCSLSSIWGAIKNLNSIFTFCLLMHSTIFIKNFHFVVNICTNTHLWNMICSSIVGNHSDIGMLIFCIKRVAKRFNRNTLSVSEFTFKIVCLCESCNKPKIYCMYVKEIAEKSLCRLLVLFIIVLFYLEYMKETATEKKFYTILQMSLGWVLPQRFKQRSARVTNTSNGVQKQVQ